MAYDRSLTVMATTFFFSTAVMYLGIVTIKHDSGSVNCDSAPNLQSVLPGAAAMQPPCKQVLIVQDAAAAPRHIAQSITVECSA